MKEPDNSEAIPFLRSNISFNHENCQVKFSEGAMSSLLDNLKQCLMGSYLNVLLVAVPFGIASHLLKWNPLAIFTLNFFAIIPSASLLTFATEELSIRAGQTIGGLLNASFGNLIELIISVIALKNGQLRLAQISLLGSIVCNLLFVLGYCFVSGGIKNNIPSFNVNSAQAITGLLMVTLTSALIPAAYHFSMSSSNRLNPGIIALSRGTSFILLAIYAMYLYVQLKTHNHFYEEERPLDERGNEPNNVSVLFGLSILAISTVPIAFFFYPESEEFPVSLSKPFPSRI